MDILGFIGGLSFFLFGINVMETGLKNLSGDKIKNLLLNVSESNLKGIAFGTGITALIQSSSASVAILQSLALAGLVRWDAAIYIVMGENIGTCATAVLSSIGTNKNAKAAAYIHLLFNVIGAVIISTLAALFSAVWI